jgi:hypothetical protein
VRTPQKVGLGFFVLAVLAVLTPSLHGQNELAADIGRLVQEREKARARVEYVLKIHSLSSEEYNKAMVGYGDLRAAFHDWIKSVKWTIESGDLKKFRKSPEFREKCEHAAQADKLFLSYIDSLINQDANSAGLRLFGNTGSIKTKIATVSDLLTITDKVIETLKKLGIRLGKDPEQEKKWLELRRQVAEAFESETKWPTWKEIITAQSNVP